MAAWRPARILSAPAAVVSGRSIVVSSDLQQVLIGVVKVQCRRDAARAGFRADAVLADAIEARAVGDAGGPDARDDRRELGARHGERLVLETGRAPRRQLQLQAIAGADDGEGPVPALHGEAEDVAVEGDAGVEVVSFEYQVSERGHGNIGKDRNAIFQLRYHS